MASREKGMLPPFADIRHLHLIGICGTAMGALAVLLKERGFRVTGSDSAVYPPMSEVLRDHDIHVASAYSPDNITPRPDLVVIGNALSRGNEEVEAVLERRIPFVSLPEALREFFIRGSISIVVTGTHGKTTTSSLLAWVLDFAGLQPGFMIGGVPANFGVGARTGSGRFFVSEGDEYDTAFFDKRSKFLHYLPDIVVVNNIEFDHADIFGDIGEIELSFRRLLNIVPRNGLVAANRDDPRVVRLTEHTWPPKVMFSLSGDADWHARNVRDTASGATFDLIGPSGQTTCELPLFGRHNVSNALAVAAVCAHVGVSLEQIRDGMRSFKGVRRRLEKLYDAQDIVLYDDFAHHPTAITETLRGVRAAHPGSRVWAIFEPRSNTTVRRFFQTELADALACGDVVRLGAVHRNDRIPESERLDIARLVSDLRERGADAESLPDVSRLCDEITSNARAGDVIVVMSNGGFGGLTGLLRDALEKRFGASESAT